MRLAAATLRAFSALAFASSVAVVALACAPPTAPTSPAGTVNDASASDASVAAAAPPPFPLEPVPVGWARHIRRDGQPTNYVEPQDRRCPEGYSLTHPYPGCGDRTPPPVCANRFFLCDGHQCSCSGKPIGGCGTYPEPWGYIEHGLIPLGLGERQTKPFPIKCTPLADPPVHDPDAGPPPEIRRLIEQAERRARDGG